MEINKLGIILVVLAALFIAGCVTPPAEETEPTEPVEVAPPVEEEVPPFKNELNNATKDEFATHLLGTNQVYIVEDLRELDEYPMTKQNIMQCGVDYAGSPGLVGKNLKVFAFDDGDMCLTLDGVLTIDECYGMIGDAAKAGDTSIIWIERGSAPEFYSNGIIVRINEVYVQGLCAINLMSPVEVEDPVAEPETNTTPELLPDVPIVEEPVEEANATDVPGDSHTFP